MSKDPETKAIETPSSGESQPSTEDITSNNTEVAAAPSPKVAVSEELMAKIVALCEKNSEAAITLNNKLQELHQKLTGIQEETDKNKRLHVQAEVTGFYNFDKRQKEIVDEFQQGEKARAKSLFDRVRSKSPSA